MKDFVAMPLRLVLISAFLAEQSLAFLPTNRATAKCVHKLASSGAPRQWRPLTLITSLSSSSSSMDYAATEAPIQEYDDDEEEDPSETYRTNIELSRLASHCARQNGRNFNTLPSLPSSLLPADSSKSYHKKYRYHHPAMLAVYLLKSMTHQDTVAYNTVLKALAKSAPAMLMDIPDDDDDDDDNTNSLQKRPQRISASQRAQNLLLEMIGHHKTQTVANQDWYERHAVGNLSEIELAQGPPRVRIKPNVRSFSTVMDAWSRCGNVDATLKVLQALEDRYIASGYDVALQPNIFSYNTVLSAYAKSYQQQQHSNGNFNEKDGRQAAQECQAFLERMLTTTSDNSNIRPDIISYNSCLHAWARSGVADAGVHAEALLRSMPMPPNTRSYTTCMDAWGRSRMTSTTTSTTNGDDINDNNNNNSNGADGVAVIKSPAARAHALLDELKDLYESTDDVQVKPNCISYTTVINAYANGNKEEPLKAQKAYGLLQEMRARGSTTDPHVLPNTVTYNSVLNACATSSLVALYTNNNHNSDNLPENKGSDNTNKSGVGEEEKLTCCLQEMITTLYNQLLLEQKITMAADSKKEDATDSNNNNNNNSFRKVTRPRLAPDHFTFGTVLKACANNIFWDDPQFGIRVFKEACRQGQVTLGVLIQLRQAVPTHTFNELLPAHAYHPKTKQFSMTDIPDAWKRNVRGRDRDAGSGRRNHRNRR